MGNKGEKVEVVERKKRFDEICIAIELMHMAEEADSSMVLPSLLSGFDDALLRLALLSQAGRSNEEFSNKFAMSLVATINAYEDSYEKDDPDFIGNLFVNTMALGANLCAMWGHKAEAIKFMVNILQANEVFECGIPATILPPMGLLISDMPEPIFRENLKRYTPYQILEGEMNDD